MSELVAPSFSPSTYRLWQLSD